MLHRAFGRPLPATHIPAPPSPLERGACYRYCEALARSRHHNFPVASRFMSSRLRRHALATDGIQRGHMALHRRATGPIRVLEAGR